jgi:hypothetical protein
MGALTSHTPQAPAHHALWTPRLPVSRALIAKGQDVQNRVFFADEEAAIAAGYRPCGHCLRPNHRQWLAEHESRAVVAGIEPEPLVHG